MKRFLKLTPALLIILAATPAQAVKVADITRMGGARTNVLTGMGLVVGLKGTGDGGDYQPAIKSLAQMLTKLRTNVNVRELANSQNVAIVSVTATIPPAGAHNGDHLDAHITSIGAAASLKGGRLFVTPMGPPGADLLFGMAEGGVVIEDATVPQTGVVKGGLVMEINVDPRYVNDAGQITLILEGPSANWTNASTIAKIINDAEGNAGETLAEAKGETTVVVTIPPNERQRPDSFISRVQRLPVPLLPTEARVQINQKTGTIIITGDVEISPVVISHKGLTITTVAPAPKPTPLTPVVTEKTAIGLDTTNTGGAKLQDLVNAMDMLKVSAEDRIIIVEELHRTGKLMGKLKISNDE